MLKKQTLLYIFVLLNLKNLALAGEPYKALLNTLSSDPATVKEAVTTIQGFAEDAITDLIRGLNSDNKLLVANTAFLFEKLHVTNPSDKEAVREKLQSLVLNGATNRIRQNAAYSLARNTSLEYENEEWEKRLNVFLQFLYDSEFLASVRGLKPVSVVMSPPNILPFKEFRQYSLGQNVEWYQPSRTTTLVIFNRKAIENLISVPEKKDLLTENGFPVEGLNVQQIIDSFKQFWNGKMNLNQYSFNLISGVFFGYPLRDVLSYADSVNEERQASGVNCDLFSTTDSEHGSVFGFYVARAESCANERNLFLSIYNLVLHWYLEQIKLKRSPYQIAQSAIKAKNPCEMNLTLRL